MRRNLVWSVGLHLLVAVLALVGLPRLWDTPPPPDTPVIVELVKIDKQTKVSVKGSDKQVVGQVAALIRGAKPPEPYKGKGVKYADEHIVRKVGKTGAK